jgi:hypothetical protein
VIKPGGSVLVFKLGVTVYLTDTYHGDTETRRKSESPDRENEATVFKVNRSAGYFFASEFLLFVLGWIRAIRG